MIYFYAYKVNITKWVLQAIKYTIIAHVFNQIRTKDNTKLDLQTKCA